MVVPFVLREGFKLSSPIDITAPYDCESLPYKTVLITGGAAGVSATVVQAMAWKWVLHGCQVVIAHENELVGCELVKNIRDALGNAECCSFVHCHLDDWDSQVDMFSSAEDFMATCGIDAVVIGASVLDTQAILPANDDDDGGADKLPRIVLADIPDDGSDCLIPPHVFDLEDGELAGVVYTAQLALGCLPKNDEIDRPPRRDGRDLRPRDRHILLLGSLPGVRPWTARPLRTAAEPTLKALFRSLCGVSERHGVRTTMLVPYLDRPAPAALGSASLPPPCRPANQAATRTHLTDVINAATRLMADESIVARGLMVGPVPVLQEGPHGGGALWHFDAGNYEQVEARVYGRVASNHQLEQAAMLAQRMLELLLTQTP